MKFKVCHLKTLALTALATLLLASAPSFARSSLGSYSSHSASTQSYHAPSTHSKAVVGVPRDASGKIKRDPKARADFNKQNPCPSTGKSSGACPGYTVDHVNPLKRGGADAPFNMQWQTNQAAKAKDKVE